VILTGYSSGGYPSLFVATKMNHIGYTGFSISTDVSLQSSIPRTLIYEKIRNQVNQSLLTNLKPAIMSGNTSRYSIYYGQRDPLDRAQAQHLQDIRGLKLIPLRDAGHELTAYLLEEGRFMETLTYHLGI
jgi:hypothetical protein